MNEEIKARPAIGLKKLVMWKLLTENETETTYDETATVFEKRIMTAKYSPTVVKGQLEADDSVVENDISVEGGSLEIGVTDLTSSERQLIYNEKIENGTNITNNDTFSGDVCVAYITPRPDGLVNLYKYPKVCFEPSEETAETKKKGSVTYQTKTLKGEISPTLHNGNSKYVRYGVNPETEKNIINSWISTATYVSPDTTE